MDKIRQKQNIVRFIQYWKNAQGSEDSECQQFWTDFCRDVLGIENTSKVLDFEKKVQGKSIDVFLENEGILIEQKSRGIDLDQNIKHGSKMLTAYEQAKEYMFLLPRSLKPYWIITCNFDYFRIYNMDEENPIDSMLEIKLEDLDKNLYLFDIFTKKEHTKLYKEEQLSYKAGEIVGTLYNKIATLYNNLDCNDLEQKSLNILITRLVFLLYAEDSGLLHETHAFLNYMKQIPANRFNVALKDIFRTLNTPIEKRDEYLEEALNAFPYINGGLFSEDNIIIPPFNETIKTELLLNASQQFDWSGISPTIFGAVFESTLNPETRRSGGMHYTSVENIHKVIDPLFLDDLKAELSEIEGERVQKTRNFKLRQFQNKLASFKILDPAAGSHNFLTETYISLRKLEIRVIENLQGNQLSIIENPIKVNIEQLYAIEINDFAVSVGKTALWIAEQQMMELTQEMLPDHEFKFFPIKHISNSVCENALRIDWNDVLPSKKCSYVIGNPPFVGSSLRNNNQKDDMNIVFGKGNKCGKCDYCVCWYKKASEYMYETDIKSAFVSTNSICQGEQVKPSWEYLFEKGVKINFARKSFKWRSEATESAGVTVIIVGFSYERKNALLFDGDDIYKVKNINGYLVDAPNVFLKTRFKRTNLDMPPLLQGNKPVDGGNLLLDENEAKFFTENYPMLKEYIRPYIVAKDFLNCTTPKRYCFWFYGADNKDYWGVPELKARFNKIREQRLASPTKEFKAAAENPDLFVQIRQPKSGYILVVPEVSSERRKYVPMAFMKAENILSNRVHFFPDATKYLFGILMSNFHNAWMRIVAGRLESRYMYQPVVYNNFVFPHIDKSQKKKIEICSDEIIHLRNIYPDKSLSDLYNPNKMPEDLKNAHLALDKAVEEAYGVDFNGNEEKIVSHLFKLYSDLSK